MDSYATILLFAGLVLFVSLRHIPTNRRYPFLK